MHLQHFRSVYTAVLLALNLLTPEQAVMFTISSFFLHIMKKNLKGNMKATASFVGSHVSWQCAVVIFILSSVKIRSKTHAKSNEDNEDVMSEIYNLVTSGFTNVYYTVEWIGQPDFNCIRDEYSSIPDPEKVIKIETNSQNVILLTVGVLASLFGIASGDGIVGIVIAGSCFGFILIMVKNTDMVYRHPPQHNPTNVAIDAPRGVYRLHRRRVGSPGKDGIAYIADGCLFTAYHITEGNPILIGDQLHYPSYIDRLGDKIAYGPRPIYLRVSEDDELFVALAGPYSNAINTYKTRATLIGGDVYHQCPKNIPGTSGSPMFKRITQVMNTANGEEVVTGYAYVGCTGNYRDFNAEYNVPRSEISGYERLRQSGDEMNTIERLYPGAHYQVFDHPGSGKTRSYLPDRVRDGLMAYGKVYVSPPTKVIAHQIYEQLAQFMPDVKISLSTSSANMSERGFRRSSVLIMAHDALADKIMADPSMLGEKALYIIDEAHFQNTKTKFLKDYLRNQCLKKKNISLVEMTATGYNLSTKQVQMHTASRHDISDEPHNYDEIIVDIAKRAKHEKLLVFITSRFGDDSYTFNGVHSRVKDKCEEFTYEVLTSDTFHHAYQKCLEMKQGVIYTTDISELGVNLSVDTVYDFRRTKKMVWTGTAVKLRETVIDGASQIQRRGRVGRDKPGRYVYLRGTIIRPMENRAEDLDRKVLAEAMELDILEPTGEDRYPLNLTKEMVYSWFSSYNTVSSPFTITLLLNKDGTMKTPSQILASIRGWKRDGRYIAPGMDMVKVNWWDDRDTSLLQELLTFAGEKILDHRHNSGQFTQIYEGAYRIYRIWNQSRKRGQAREPISEEGMNEEGVKSGSEGEDE